jgi:hypothetical protein
MQHDIGYMQVHMRLYSNEKIYETFVINAFDGCYCIKTDLISSHHEVINDEAKVYDKIFQIKLEVFETDFTIMLHMPIHQSGDWEVIHVNDNYTVGFYCNLGDKGKSLLGEHGT